MKHEIASLILWLIAGTATFLMIPKSEVMDPTGTAVSHLCGGNDSNRQARSPRRRHQAGGLRHPQGVPNS